MPLYRDSQIEAIVSAEHDLAAAIAAHGDRSGFAIRARGRVLSARNGASQAENLQASHEVGSGDSSGRHVRGRRETGYRSLTVKS